MRANKLYISLVLAGLFMGLLLAVQFRLTRETASSPNVQRAQNLVTRVNDARVESEQKQKKLKDLRSELDKLASDVELGAIKDQIEQNRLAAGMSDAYGPGIEVTLNDSNLAVQPGENPNLYVLHDEDVLKVLNELRAAGAEALSINGQRVVANTEVRCIGPTILINKNQRLTPPFVISAIGNQNTMINSLKMRGGVVETLEFWGIQVSVKKLSEVKIQALTGGYSLDYAVPVQEEDKADEK